MEQPSVGVRKNINALEESQRKQFFWCMKMLAIIPSFQAIRQRHFISRGFQGNDKHLNQIQPSCLLDELVSNHGTCCQHHNFFFPHYHRHLMVQFQLRLNYVDECLKLSPQAFQQKFKELYSKEPELWNKILSEYKRISQSKQKVMAHYWNPTNFNNRDDLVIPIEISDPQIFPHELDEVDQMHFLVQNSYPYELNVKTRWHRNPTQYDKYRSEFSQSFRPFHFTQQQYSQFQQKLMEGVENARSASDAKEFNQKYTNYIDNSVRQVVNNRNKTKWDDPMTKDRINLMYMNQGEYLVGFGGRTSHQKIYNMHYFNQKELQQTEDMTQHAAKVTYNQWLPHYCAGVSLFNEDNLDLIKFLQNTNCYSIDRSHDIMHSAMRFSMSDSSFSNMSFIFYLFHSWIDLHFQIKLRMCDNPQQASRIYNKLTMVNSRAQRFDTILNPHQEQKSFGSYPIMQWADPNFFMNIVGFGDFKYERSLCQKHNITQKSIVHYFHAYQYFMRNSEQIRTSTYLRQFYENYYIDQNLQNFHQFKGFSTYDAGYDYQVLGTVFDQKKKQIKHQKAMLGNYPNLKIPQYLRQMKNQVNIYHDSIKKRADHAFTQQHLSHSNRLKNGLFKNKLLARIRYSSSVRNGTYCFNANFSTLLKVLIEQGVQLTQSQKQYLSTDQTVLALPVFGREQDSKNCLNCGQSKYKIVNMDQQFYLRSSKLWSFINKILTKQKLFDSQNSNQSESIFDTVDVKQFIDLNPMKHQFQLTYIQGAEEVDIQIIVESDSPVQPHQIHIDLFLNVVKIQNGKATSLVSKVVEGEDLSSQITSQTCSYKCKYNFSKLVDVDSSLTRNDLDGLVYKNVFGTAIICNQSTKFYFDIRHHHDLIRYQLIAKIEKGQVRVKVVDKDYQLKRMIFDAQ